MKKSGYIFIFACFIPLLLFRDFTPNNELKYLSIADEAIRNGHFFTFQNHGILYADKPPFYFWIIMLSKWLFGVHSMFFLGLFSLLPALGVLYIMEKWTKEEMPSVIHTSNSLALITSGLFTGAAIVLRMDMLMCLFIVLSLYTFYRLYSGKSRKYDKFLLPVYIFFAIFTKGPAGLMIPLLSISAFLLINRKLKEFGKYMGGLQWSILIGLCLIWFAGVYFETGITYLNDLLFHQTFHRAIDSFHHKAPFWYYFQTIGYCFTPWTLFYFALIVLGIKKHQINTQLKKLFLTIIATTFISLSLFSSKLDIYLLPMYPFVSTLSFLLATKDNLKRIRFTLALPAILFVFSLPIFFIAEPHIPIPLSGEWLVPFAVLVLSISAGFCLYFLHRHQIFHAINALSIGLLLTIFIGGFAISRINEYIGLKKISQKATIIAQEKNIKDFYFYKFRSGENMDSYLKKEIKEVNPSNFMSLLNKQSFILFVKDKDLNKNKELQNIANKSSLYTIGNYHIIAYKLN